MIYLHKSTTNDKLTHLIVSHDPDEEVQIASLNYINVLSGNFTYIGGLLALNKGRVSAIIFFKDYGKQYINLIWSS